MNSTFAWVPYNFRFIFYPLSVLIQKKDFIACFHSNILLPFKRRQSFSFVLHSNYLERKESFPGIQLFWKLINETVEAHGVNKIKTYSNEKQREKEKKMVLFWHLLSKQWNSIHIHKIQWAFLLFMLTKAPPFYPFLLQLFTKFKLDFPFDFNIDLPPPLKMALPSYFATMTWTMMKIWIFLCVSNKHYEFDYQYWFIIKMITIE